MGKVAIIGLGLIGGSLGLAIKRAKPPDTTVIGYDRDWEVATRAHKAGAVSQLAETAEAVVAIDEVADDYRTLVLEEAEYWGDADDDEGPV